MTFPTLTFILFTVEEDLKLENLLEILPDNYTIVDRELIERAYNFTKQAHTGQSRSSGESYLTHCVAVAAILAELHMPPNVVIAGLLHDTLANTNLTTNDLKREFGDEIANLVNEVTRISSLPSLSENRPTVVQSREIDPATPHRSRQQEANTEALRKMLLAMNKDIRVLIIKLADRLHNMRTLGNLPENRRLVIAQETLDIYAPLANRLGIWQIKSELEDLSFRYLDPETYKEIADKLSKMDQDHAKKMALIIQKLRTVIEEAGIQARISGRTKHIYSIYRKMVTKGKPFEMVRDVRGVRLIVNEVADCYHALGVIHNRWRPIPSEFDDYIASPKNNFYQSLHTAVIFEDGKPLEVQIRTQEMDTNAEYGIAAHWRYKEGGRGEAEYEQRVNWLRRLLEWQNEVKDSQEFLDGVKSDIFQDRVYVFTPRGDIIDLPAGATPIDFAYHVHTQIGHRCRGAKINGKLVTLDYTLKSGDQVEILTAKQGGPSRDWLNSNLGLVKTPRARSKIRAWFIHLDREQNLTQGKLLLEKEFRRLGIQTIDIDKLTHALEYRSADDLYVALGCGNISISRIISELNEINEAEKHPVEEIPRLVSEKPAASTGVQVTGIKGLLINLAHCCNPAPGDEIVGYITQGRGATIHRAECANIVRLRQKNPDRIIQVDWGEPQRTYPVNIQIKAFQRQGLLTDISSTLTDESIGLRDIRMNTSSNIATFQLTIEINDITQLSRILNRLENIPNVMEARRLTPG